MSDPRSDAARMAEDEKAFAGLTFEQQNEKLRELVAETEKIKAAALVFPFTHLRDFKKLVNEFERVRKLKPDGNGLFMPCFMKFENHKKPHNAHGRYVHFPHMYGVAVMYDLAPEPNTVFGEEFKFFDYFRVMDQVTGKLIFDPEMIVWLSDPKLSDEEREATAIPAFSCEFIKPGEHPEMPAGAEIKATVAPASKKPAPKPVPVENVTVENVPEPDSEAE